MSGWARSAKFPSAHVFMTEGGVFAVRGWRRKKVSVLKSDLGCAQEKLARQFRRIHRQLRVMRFGTEGLAVFFDPILERARIRLVHSERGGPEGRGRWDIWHPQLHMKFLSERRKRQDVTIKSLRGVVVTERQLFELDAVDWKRVFATSELVFKLGPEIDSGAR